MRLHWRIMLAALLAWMLSACTLLTQTLGLDEPPAHDPALVACKSFRIITFDRLKDTDETILQVKQHNAAFKALCPVSNAPSPAPATGN